MSRAALQDLARQRPPTTHEMLYSNSRKPKAGPLVPHSRSARHPWETGSRTRRWHRGRGAGRSKQSVTAVGQVDLAASGSVQSREQALKYPRARCTGGRAVRNGSDPYITYRFTANAESVAGTYVRHWASGWVGRDLALSRAASRRRRSCPRRDAPIARALRRLVVVNIGRTGGRIPRPAS